MTPTNFSNAVDGLVTHLISISRLPNAAAGFINEYDLLIKQQNASMVDLTNQYLRFIVSTFAMSHFMYTRELTHMHAWIVRGLTDDYGSDDQQEQLVDCSRVDLFSIHPLISTHQSFDRFLILWLIAFYYYCAEQTALDAIGEYFLDMSMTTVRAVGLQSYDEPRAFLLSRLMTWAVQTNHESALEITQLNEKLALSNGAKPACRSIATIGLSTRSGGLSKAPPKFWANYALTHFSKEFVGDQLLSLLHISWDGTDGKVSKKIITAIRKLRGQITLEAKSKQHLRLIENGRSELIKPVIGKAIAAGNARFAHEAVCIWYGIDKIKAISPSAILWQIPAHADGLLFMLNGTTFKSKRNSQDELIKLTAASNEFLGTSISVRGTPSADLFVPDRFGHPVHETASAFKDALVSAYLPNDVIPQLTENLKPTCRQIILPSKSHPIQGVQLKRLRDTWPLTASFTEPAPDAALHKVAIWSTSGIMGQDFELSIVQDIFRRKQIQVDVFSAETYDSKPFSEVYQDPTYDVIWLISHGEYKHFSPKDSHLSLGEGKSIDVEEMLELQPFRTHRRLFVMNVCDGGTHPGEGLLPRIGMAASVASSLQAVISHKWPVAVIPAAAFGSILASNLSDNEPFFSAFKRTVLTMIDSSPDFFIPDEINLHTDASIALNDRMQRSPEKIFLFEHFSSAAFFE